MDLSDLLAAAAGPSRPPMTMSSVYVSSTSPLILDDFGTVLDGGVRVLSSYSPQAGDVAIMLRAGGLAVLIGAV